MTSIPVDMNAVLTASAKAASARDRRLAAIRAEGARRLELLGAAYAAVERETWHQQQAEAAALLADPSAPALFLRARAVGRGITPLQMAQTVVTKAQQFAAASGAILAAQDRIMAMDPPAADPRDDALWPNLGAS